MENQTKKKGNNNVVWIALLIIIIVAIVWLVNKKPSGTLDNPTVISTGGSGASLPTTTFVTVTDTTVLKRGMENDYVLKLQQLINKVNVSYGLPKIAEDGDFGSGTEAALKKLTGKTQISYADAEQAASEKFKAQGYGDSFISGILSGLNLGFFNV